MFLGKGPLVWSRRFAGKTVKCVHIDLQRTSHYIYAFPPDICSQDHQFRLGSASRTTSADGSVSISLLARTCSELTRYIS